MGAVEDFIILGMYSGDRMTEYTKPGYERYGRSLAEEVVPEVERRGIRVERHRRFRSVWGSSLGGVVSFYTVWQHPDVFGSAVCMSSTFSHKDDLIDRVFQEPFRDVGFYLDSGWPGDNYEVTVGMAMALISRGWEYGRNLLHLCFPNAGHGEEFWGTRLHLPMQFLNGAVARAARVQRPVLGDPPFPSVHLLPRIDPDDTWRNGQSRLASAGAGPEERRNVAALSDRSGFDHVVVRGAHRRVVRGEEQRHAGDVDGFDGIGEALRFELAVQPFRA